MRILYMNDNKYNVIVVGAGHAGIEAALSSARLGMKTLVFYRCKRRCRAG